MCFISLDRKKRSLFFEVLFVCPLQLDQEISPFSITAADHWCLSLKVPVE